MTSTSLHNEILKAQCCVADLGYKALKDQMYLKADYVSTFKDVKYVHSLINILIRHYNVIYSLGDSEACLTTEEIETIIEEIRNICDSCGCCRDRLDITKDI
jgi:hypothetical protein